MLLPRPFSLSIRILRWIPLLLVLACDTPSYPPWISGALWTVETGGRKRLCYVTEEERQKTVGSRRSSGIVSYTRYELVARDLGTGQLLDRVRLADERNAPAGRGPEIIGPASGGLWLWNGGPEVRDPATLEVRFTAEKLRVLNPNLANLLPGERNFYKVSAPHQALLFKGADANFYQIDATSGRIGPADAERLRGITPSRSVEKGFTYVQPPGRYLFYGRFDGHQVKSFVTPTNQWYALLTDEERARLSRWPGSSNGVYGEVARRLYRAPYVLDDRRKVEIAPAQAQPLGTGRYVQGGFLKRTPQAVWDVPDPSSSLVLCKNALGQDQPWVLVRLARDGRELWRQSTGIADLVQMADGGTAVVLYGYADRREPLRLRPARLVWVDTATGRRTEVVVRAEEP